MPDTETILQLFALAGYAILLFTAFFAVGLIKGRQTVANALIGLWLAWPVWLAVRVHLSPELQTTTWFVLLLFIGITAATTWLTRRIMPDEFKEKTFESTGKKLLLAGGATVLVLVITFVVLDVTDSIPGGEGVAIWFAPNTHSIWWLILVYLALFLGL